MEYVFQAATSCTHTSSIKRLLGTPDIKRVVIGAAFVTNGGVKLIEADLSPHAGRTIVLAGVRNELTSFQGLEALLGTGVKLFIVDVGQTRRIYHPKVYLARGATRARLIVGSANLTTGGLNNNIEGSLLVDLDLGQARDAALVQQVEASFDNLVAHHPKNVLEIKKLADIKHLSKQGLIVDERSRRAPVVHRKGGSISDTPPMTFKTKASAEQQEPIASPPPISSAVTGPWGEYQLVWKSKPLRESNINLYTSPTAAPKNVLSLGQGGLPTKIPFQTYFRHQVFAGLAWVPADIPNVDEGTGTCELAISGVLYGTFPLRVRHSKNVALTTMNQANVATRLVWGDMLPHVSRPENLGKVLYLSRDIVDPTSFLIEID